MADIAWPEDLAPYGQSFWLQPHVGRSESPFTRQVKTYGLSAPRWITRMPFRGGYDNQGGLRDVGGRMDAMIVKLKGGANRALIWDFRRPTRTGPGRDLSALDGTEVTFTLGETFALEEVFGFTYPDDPASAAAVIGATEMAWEGFEPNTIVFKPGDYVGGDGRAHLITEAGATDAYGKVTVTFEPALGAAIPAGAAIYEKVTSPFRLSSDDAGANPAEVGGPALYDLEFFEDL